MTRLSRSRKLATIAPPYDVTDPPTGALLWLGVTAAKLGVTAVEMAQAAGLTKPEIAAALTNAWPGDEAKARAQQALTSLLYERGATAEELARLFHACQRGMPQGRKPTGPDVRFQPPPPRTRPHRRLTAREIEMLLSKQTLTPEARRHFKLFRNPFAGDVQQDGDLFVSDSIAMYREAVWQCARTASFLALVGESGSGKTTLLQDVEARLERENHPLIVFKPSVLGMEGSDTRGKAIKSTDILHAIITTLRPDGAVPQTLQARTVLATRLLTNSAKAGNEHLLVVEEAHCMPDATLKHLKRLHEMKLIRKPLLGILLLAQPELSDRLADGLRDGSLREVAQRCELLEMAPLDADLEKYMQARVRSAGAAFEAIFDADAVEALRERLTFNRGEAEVSVCYPLAVNNMATRAMNVAADLGVPRVNRDVLQAA